MDTYPGRPRPGPSPRHVTLWFYFLNVSRILSCASIQAVITLDQACSILSPALLQCPVSDLPTCSSLPRTHFPHGSQCDGWKMPVWFLSTLLSTTQCFSFLLEWRLKSPTLPTNPCAGSSCHLASLLSLSMFQLTHFFPLTHYFFSCSFWNNFRHAKRCKNSAKIFHLCFTQLP